LSKRPTTPRPQYNPSAPRVSKREQLRNQRRRRSLTWNVIVLGTLAVFLLAVAGYVISIQRPGVIAGEQVIADEGAAVYPDGQALTYKHYPPSSGQRYAEAGPWGFAEAPVPEGNFVTNLHRGGVVFLYQCTDPCEALENQFKDLLAGATPETTYNTVKILVTRASPEHPLPSQIVALAWNHELDLASFDKPLLLRWYKRFVNQGPGNAP